MFSITGIAEAAKNVSPDRIEIGEKGIGFKSVFGVADKVLIQSGMFSFILYENNFTVPEEHYEDFCGISGTKLTLYMKTKDSEKLDEFSRCKARAKICRDIYDKLVSEYRKKTSLFNKNPILFLNKLTKIRIWIDQWDSLEFSVSKGKEKEKIAEGLERENDVVISSSLNARCLNQEKQNTEVVCTRYTMPIEYDRSMCVSRYGSKTSFQKKKLQLQVVILNPEFVSEVSGGTLYLFLPTQVKTTVPISCHVPFKLDSSREYVDDQGENAWFKHSRDMFAEMLHFVYKDYARSVKNKILTYVPYDKKHFFAIDEDNDKLRCLERDSYLGSSFLQDSILCTEEGHFKSSSEVFAFHPGENIADPIALYRLAGYGKELFIAPEKCNVSAYGIEIVKDSNFRLFERAMKTQVPTQEALDILDSNDVAYEEFVKRLSKIKLDTNLIIELSKHPKCFQAFNAVAISNIKSNKSIGFEVSNGSKVKVEDVHFVTAPDEELKDTDFGKTVYTYLSRRNYAYTTAELSNEQCYFISQNVLVLSQKDKLNAFAQFHCAIEKRDLFSAKLQIRAASNRLNKAENSFTVSEYMNLLYKVRSAIIDVLGKEQYANYIKAIRELNADPKSFIRELIQNADDCDYDVAEHPTFNLSVNGNTITTSYNELGFQKKNVRAITAIGESTKNQFWNDSFKIGEKGVGFKTVFAVADHVDIYSNEFHFRLKATTPTIPDIIEPLKETLVGTKMIFKLRNHTSFNFELESILALCLCLRKLKEIAINGTKIEIEDVNEQRIIRVDQRKYVFDVYRHSFIVTDQEAIKERSEGNKHISENQEITFYIPEKNLKKSTYYLYCGLPTTIEIGVPFAIDVPFELTTSRDSIIQNKWNNYLRGEMYQAYIEVLQKISRKNGIDVLRYLRFQNPFFGLPTKISLFKNDENGWINENRILDKLRTCKFIPTYDKNYFAMPIEDVYRCPRIIHSLMDAAQLDEQSKRQIIATSKSEDDDNKLKTLGCKQLDDSGIARIVCERAHLYILDEKIRNALYDYLEGFANKDALKSARIIPIKLLPSKRGEQEQYVSFDRGPIYVDESATGSTSEYMVLDTDILKKHKLEEILGETIKSLGEDDKNYIYFKKIESIIVSNCCDEEKYHSLINELKRNSGQFKNAIGYLLKYREEIPLLAEDGEYHTGHMFITSFDNGYFSGSLIKSHVASKGAMELASLIDCQDIVKVNYEDLNVNAPLSEDDIEDLLYGRDGKIHYKYEILERCIFDGFISEELVERYNLIAVKRPDYSDYFDEEDFPNDPIKNYPRLQAAISKKSGFIGRIKKEKTQRVEDFVQYPNGEKLLKGSEEKKNRRNILKRYCPPSNTDVCFCQMCRSVKSWEYMEVNNIQVESTYYWTELRVVLCLECSKRFEALRSNEKIRDEFFREIKNANPKSDEAVAIPIGSASIRFTQTHLAEIQEILKTGKT